jgi:hypothetical protein
MQQTATSLGSYQGLLITQHALPEGCIVVEIKFCETCGQPFTRTKPTFRPIVFTNKEYDGDAFLGQRGLYPTSTIYRDTGRRYCGPCQSRLLLPPDDSEYRDLLPTSAEMAHRNYLPHYDESLLPKKRGDNIAKE